MESLVQEGEYPVERGPGGVPGSSTKLSVRTKMGLGRDAVRVAGGGVDLDAIEHGAEGAEQGREPRRRAESVLAEPQAEHAQPVPGAFLNPGEVLQVEPERGPFARVSPMGHPCWLSMGARTAGSTAITGRTRPVTHLPIEVDGFARLLRTLDSATDPAQLGTVKLPSKVRQALSRLRALGILGYRSRDHRRRQRSSQSQRPGPACP